MNQINLHKLGVRLEYEWLSTFTGTPDDSGSGEQWLTLAEAAADEAGWFLTQKADWWRLAADDLHMDGGESDVPDLLAYYESWPSPPRVSTYSTAGVLRRRGSRWPLKVRWDRVTLGRFGELSRVAEEYSITPAIGEAAVTVVPPAGEAIADGALHGTRPYALVRVEHVRIFTPCVASY